MDSSVTKEEHTRCLDICIEHLGGAWKKVPSSEVDVRRLSGGMSNLLYRCTLPGGTKTVGKEPDQILLRFYGPSYSDTELQLEIFNLLAAENLGPKLFGTFEGGRLEEYLPAGPLVSQEMTDDKVSAIVARKIAAIHKLKVQSLQNKSHEWLIDKYNSYDNFIKEVLAKRLSPFKTSALESTKRIALDLLAIDFRLEIDYVSRLLRSSKAPLVFSHNDLHQNNILLMQDPNKDLNDRIVLIDFEYCSYNYRTFDAANHLSEWCFDYNGDKYPYFNANLGRFPSEEKQRQFLGNYIQQMLNLDVQGDRNPSKFNEQVDTLFDEMQPFLMASNLLWTVWAIQSAYTSKIDFGYWEMARYKFDIYLLCKKNFQSKSTQNNGCERKVNVQQSKM